MNKKLVVLLITLLFSRYLLGQSKYSDSLVVGFGKSNINNISVFVDKVTDTRNSQPNCLGVWEKKRYVLVPIDNFLMIQKPLATEIKEIFLTPMDSSANKKYRLEINEFKVSSIKQMFSKKYACNAAVSVFSFDESKKYHYSGTLFYQTSSALKIDKKNIKAGYEDILDRWKSQFIIDMVKICAYQKEDSLYKIPNFKKVSFPIRKTLYLNLESFVGSKSLLIDGEIIFSRPEIDKKFLRQAYCIRYRHEQKYESFETSLSNSQKNIRLSENFVFTLKTKLFMGLNRWNDSEYKKHGIEDIFLLDCSLSQSVAYNPLSKKGLTAGIGLMENATFIYSEDTAFKPYLVVQIGIKL